MKECELQKRIKTAENQTIINYYRNVKNPAVEKSITLYEWFSMIEYSPFSPIIKKARDGEVDYDATKVGVCPCVTFNFEYDKYKKNSNMVGPTGVLFIDIDNPEFHPSMLDYSKVLACYKSFGGQGYSILVRVESLTNESYKPTLLNVVDQLELSDIYDKGASKPTQFSVLSYDPDIFVNYNSHIFPILHTSSYSNNIYKKNNIYIDKKRKDYTPKDTFSGKMRTSNLSDYLDNIDFGGKSFVDLKDSPIQYAKLFLPDVIKSGVRHNTICTICSQAYGLNPYSTKQKLFSYTQKVNKERCQPPLPTEEVLSIVTHYFSKDPVLNLNKWKRILFDPSLDLSLEKRQSISAKYLAKQKKEGNTCKIQEVVDYWDIKEQGKITYPKIAAKAGVSLITVKRRNNVIKLKMKKINKKFGKLNKK